MTYIVSLFLAKTSWTSSKDMDRADWQRNNNQLETNVQRSVDIVESRHNGPQPSMCYDDDDDDDDIFSCDLFQNRDKVYFS